MDTIAQVMHECDTCAAIKPGKRLKPLWYGGRWLKYKYGEAWQIGYITLPQTRQGKRHVLTMVEATTGWLETYPVPHATAWNTILGLEKQVLWSDFMLSEHSVGIHLCTHDIPYLDFPDSWVLNLEELEAIVHQENYDMVAIMETWWDDSHNWSAAMDGYKLFRRDRRGRRGGGVALYVRECLDSLELDDGDDRVECLWVRIRGKANKADIVVGVCYRPPNQDEETDELFYKQLGEASRSLALVLVGDFNLPDVCWKYNTAERKQSRTFLECAAGR
ncbi:hypothetical protein QYF61_013641 [Mycteria americana]|uniref:Endonuclease/exonuclease/phosphatase domain-containing protein n=1 Tax=Mycteria americana TaxID=33587 RepID=A0AAN7NSC7_MYCAM|nr:hypothetical protein QYF61_013641 [Mycteria americana]